MHSIPFVLACLCFSVADYQPGTPLTYVFDTVAPAAAPLEPGAAATKKDWLALEEDDLKHAFRGDAVLANDKLVVVLRRQGPGVEIYAQSPAGMKYRGAASPSASLGAKPGALQSIRILENSTSAVMLEAAFGVGKLKVRLTTGQSLLELRPGENTKALGVAAPADWAVVPDFFGDDVVIGGQSAARQRVGLPAENFFLTLSDQGSAILMCVWPSSSQRAELVLSEGAIAGLEIAASQKADQPIWLAFLEGRSLWHAGPLPPSGKAAIDWKPPFPAKWRADVIQTAGLADSSYIASGDETPHASATGGQLLIYPMDRSRATPIATFCPIDILRNTLGVGPCQYILQTEGLATDTNPTPDNVMNWVEQQFAKKKEKRARDEIQALLEQMTEHVGHAQARIARYAAAVEEIRGLLPAADPLAEPLRPTLDFLKRAVARPAVDPQARARELAGQVVALIGRPGAADECRRLGLEIRGVGSSQDAAMARARMGLRWLREQACWKSRWATKIVSRVDEALSAR